jgi:hypothetical protein
MNIVEGSSLNLFSFQTHVWFLPGFKIAHLKNCSNLKFTQIQNLLKIFFLRFEFCSKLIFVLDSKFVQNENLL